MNNYEGFSFFFKFLIRLEYKNVSNRENENKQTKICLI